MKKVNVRKTIILLVLVIGGVITCINPLYPHDMFLQHIGTILLLAILAVDLRKNFLYFSSFLGIALFTLLHIVAARYVYSFVPYNDWFQSLFGVDIDRYFNFQRNQFDRFVHFAFGILVFPWLMQLFGKWKGLSRVRVIIIAWLTIQFFSMVYELFEWSLTLVMSGEAAENYNGQQGDIWDAHKDMVLAMFGSTIIGLVYLFKRDDK